MMESCEKTPTSSSSDLKQAVASLPRERRRRRGLLAGAAAVLIVTALALGLGLGLGLHKKRSLASSPLGGPSNSNVSSVMLGPDGQLLSFIPREKLVDPSQFRLDPAWNRSAPPTVRSYNWTISRVLSNPAGVTKPMLVVNGLSPGPTIEANVGDTVLVAVTNALQNVSTAIHWHGQQQNGSNFMDGTMGITECGIAPGQTRVYQWEVQNTGTYWWHSHAGVNTEYSDGLVGALILHSPNDTYHLAEDSSSSSNNNTYDEDLVIPVSDAWHSTAAQWLLPYTINGGIGATYDYPEPVPDTGLVAGYGTGTCDGLAPGTPCDGGALMNFTVQPNKRYRLRVINTGSLASIQFSVDSHPLTLIEADGTEVEPQIVSSFGVNVAQRYSVLIDTNQTSGAFYIRGTIMQDMLGYNNPALNLDQRALMVYADAPANAQASDVVPELPGNLSGLSVDSLRPVVKVQAPAPTRQVLLVVDFGVSSDGTYRAFINGTSWSMERSNSTLLQAYNAVDAGVQWTPPDSQSIVTIDGVEVVDIAIMNQNDGSHPFHMHGYTPMIMASGVGAFSNANYDPTANADNPMRRDVYSVPTFGWMVVRIVSDVPGMWIHHCHLVSHLSIGLATQFQVQPSVFKQWGRSAVDDGCAAVDAFNANSPAPATM